MYHNNLPPNSITLNQILAYYARVIPIFMNHFLCFKIGRLKSGEELFKIIKKENLPVDAEVYETIISMNFVYGNYNRALGTFSLFAIKNVLLVILIF